MIGQMAKERGGNCFDMDDRYCIDNGCMIAYTGLLEFAQGKFTPFCQGDHHTTLPNGRSLCKLEKMTLCGGFFVCWVLCVAMHFA